MMQKSRALMLASWAGLALTMTAQAQYAVVSGLPGTFVTGVDNPVNLIVDSQGDEVSVGVTIPAAYDNAFLPAGFYYAESNGRFTSDLDNDWTNESLNSGSAMGFYPHWDDMRTDDYAESGIYAADLGDMFVIQWNADPYDYEEGGYPAGYLATNAKIQLQILPTGGTTVARFVYQGMGTMTGQSATVGAVSQAGLAATYSHNTADSLNDSVVLSVISAVTGACCRTDGTCFITTGDNCTALGGIYRGDNSDCATADCPLPPGTWVESDAQDLPATAEVPTGSGPLNTIRGNIGTGDVDMYKINICDPASFTASTVGQADFDTMLWLVDASGNAVVGDDDDNGAQSTIGNPGTIVAGEHYIAVAHYSNEPQDAAGADLFAWGTPYWTPAGVGPIAMWSGDSDTGSDYGIALTGACFAEGGGTTCYANCDQSTTEPVLNVADFSCFLQQFGQGSSYANCDQSTAEPVLNVADFSCFLQAFAAGCP